MSTERLFIALTLPPSVRDALATMAQPLPGVNWTRRDHLHVTLRFLGDVPAGQKDDFLPRLERIRVEPFILPLEGIGTFPPGRPPRVLWIGVGAGHPRLFQLRQRLDDALLASGIDLDVRRFHPHVTLARSTENAARSIAHWLHRHRESTAPSFQVDAFDLYASELHPEGARHTLLRQFPLLP